MSRRLFTVLVLCALLALCGCGSFKKSLFESGMSMERWRSSLTEKTVQAGDLTVSYLERPGTGETIVMLHGFGADKTNWIRFARYLPKEYRLIAVDLPGHGSNARDWKRTYDIDSYVKGFADTADALRLDRFHLAGNSMGGYVSVLYSSEHPDRILTLCLIDSAGAISPRPGEFRRALERGDNPLVPKTRSQFYKLMDYAFCKKPFLPWPTYSVLADRSVELSSFNEKLWNDINTNRKDIASYLGGLRMPVLLLWGDKDRIIDVSTVSVFEQHIPHVQTVICKDCGHVPMIEIPKVTADTYVGFLDGAGKTAVPAKEAPGEAAP